jgi:hypothetical protein
MLYFLLFPIWNLMNLCGVWIGRSNDSAQQFAWEQFDISRPTFGDAEKNTFIP